MATANEQWSKASMTKGAGRQWTARRYWIVSNADDVEDAMDASGIPSLGDSHPLSASLKCVDVSSEGNDGPTVFDVIARYAIPDDGANPDGGGTATDPLDEPVRVLPRTMLESVEVDRDIDGNPLLNSALDAIVGAYDEHKSITLDVFRYEPYFDLALAFDLLDSVNSTAFSIPGVVVGIPAESARLIDMTPTSEYQPNPQYVEVRYSFHIDLTGHDFKFIDKGRRAWARTPGDAVGEARPFPIYTRDGELASDDVLLNGEGEPVSNRYITGHPELGLASTSVTGPSSLPAGATIADATGGYAKVLTYKKKSRRDFNAFNFGGN